MSDKPILDRLQALADANPGLQQFGQKHSDHVHGGKTACTHTVCQFLSLAWKGTTPTLNDVNRLAGMPRNAMAENGDARGMRPGELQNFLTNAKIPMKIVRGLSFSSVLAASNDGPVFYGMRYGSAPVRTKSHPNGTTQKGIPDTRHAVVLLGFRDIPATGGKPARRDVYRKEPNHGSPNRPERPPYDTISDRQARIEYEHYRDKLGQSLYAAVPTRRLLVIGSFLAPAAAQAPPLVLTALEPFSGTATVRGDGHSAVQVADREFIALPDGTEKRVVALARLVPRLPGPSGDRTNVVLVGDEAAILLRADVTLRTDGGDEVLPPATEAEEDVPEGPEIDVPDGDPTDDDDDSSNGPVPID